MTVLSPEGAETRTDSDSRTEHNRSRSRVVALPSLVLESCEDRRAVCVRFPENDYQTLRAMADEHRLNLSDVLRLLVRAAARQPGILRRLVMRLPRTRRSDVAR